MNAPRESVLRFVASGIHGLTIRAGSFYDEPESWGRMRETNEAIHRLSGHLRALILPEEPLTESRVAGITRQVALLPRDEVARIEAHCLAS
jgi:hypothetical protein